MDALADISIWPELTRGARKRPEPPGPIFQFGDPVGFEWNTYALPIDNLPTALHGLRIVHISDAHCRPEWKRAYDDLGDRLAQCPPDLVLFTGDLVEERRGPRRSVGVAKRMVAAWKATLGVFGIRGNHDLQLPMSRFNDSPMRNIEGQTVVVRKGGAELEVIGLLGPDRVDFPPTFSDTIAKRRAGVPRIVMSHYPDHIRRCRSMRPDLFLAGHTHAGQVCLPGLIPIIRHDSLLWRYTRGVHWFENQWLVVNRGLGFSLLPIRLLCPAEVIELILVPSHRS